MSSPSFGPGFRSPSWQSGTHDQLGALAAGGARAAMCELALSPVVLTVPHEQIIRIVGSAQTFTSGNIQVPETGIGFFAIPIMVLAGTPAGPPSAPRRHAAHQVRGIARQQGPRGQGPG
jgi:hypothetical protein